MGMMDTTRLAQMSEQYVKQHEESAVRPSGATATNIACPTCDAENKESPLTTQLGTFGYRCQAGHIFNDTASLLAQKPRMLAVVVPAPAPEVGAIAVPVPLKPDARAALAQRFGEERLLTTLALALTTLAHPDSFVVDGDEANRISQHYGEKVGSAAKLVGVISEMKSSREQAQAEVKELRLKGQQQGGMAEDGILKRLSPACIEKLQSVATFQNVVLEKLLTDMIEYAVANGWIA